jgi:hypothetical protein
MFLDGETRIFEKTKILDVVWIVEIDEDGYPLARFGLKYCA